MQKQNRLIDSINKTFKECIDIAHKKTKDYATDDNPFKNFEISTVVGVKPERAILVRIMDKVSRISNLLEKDPDAKDESINDSINDAINYFAILKAYLNG